ISGSVTLGANNLIGNGTGSTGIVNGMNGNLVGTAANPINPYLAPLANYGGPSKTIALLPGSPAIDAGTSTGVPTNDQRGKSRVGGVDIGAFESGGFTIIATSGSGQSANADTTFAAPLIATVTAKNAVEPVAGGVVTFTAPTTGASATITGSPATIAAGGKAQVTASANDAAGTYNVLATALGITTPATFQLTNQASVPADTTAPTVTISGPSVAITAGGTVTYTVTYFDANFAASSLTAADITLNKTGTANGTVSVDAGTGATRTVTISGITGDGTLSISLAAGTAADVAGNLAPAAGPSNPVAVASRFVVDNTSDIDDGNFTIGNLTLREAVALANAAPGANTITFDPTVFATSQTITFTNGRLAITDTTGTTTITGPAAGVMVNGNNLSGVFSVATGVTASLSRMIITGGLAPFGGGGVLNNGTLTLTDSTLAGNTATFGGGGVFNNGTATVTNCTIFGNDAVFGGGVFDNGTLSLTNCTVTGNAAAETGGGVLNNGTLTLTNTIVASQKVGSDISGSVTLGAGSPAIDAGISTGAPTNDQRGKSRVGGVDIGAFESGGFTIVATSGSGQSANADTTFASPLVATVTAKNSVEPVAGGVVTFTAPTTGATAAITGSPATIAADGKAQVTATANETAGTYNVSATASGITTPATFQLTNQASVPADTTAPTVTISGPSVAITAGSSITYTVTYFDANFAASSLTAANITLNKTGTANGTVSVDAGTGATRTVTISGITGDGTLSISLAAGTAADVAGNLAPAAGPSSPVTVDNTAPTVTISLPSKFINAGGSVTYTVTYADSNFAAVTLTAADVTLNKTGTANGTVSVGGTGATRTVMISSITGNGTLSISLAAGTARDAAGNLALATGPSAPAAVDTTAPIVTISSPSVAVTASAPVTFIINYSNVAAVTLTAADVTLNKTGTANGTISIGGTGATRTVTISGITGDGTLGISLAAGTAADVAGNLAPAAGPSTLATVDNTAPTVTISGPSVTLTAGAPVTFTITYADANFATSTLTAANITLNKTGTANGTVSVSGTGTTRTVTISGITGDGTLGISLAAGTARDLAGNLAPAVGPSSTTTAVQAFFAIGNFGGTVSIVYAPTGSVLKTVRPLDAGGTPYSGLVEVALGDFNGDGIADLAVSAADPLGANGLAASKAGRVFVYDGAVLAAGTLTRIHTFTPFVTTDGPDGNTGQYTNGLNIAAGDVNGDGKVDLIAGTRGIAGGVGTAEYGRLIVVNQGTATDGSQDTFIGSNSRGVFPFGAPVAGGDPNAGYQKGVFAVAGNADGVGGDEIAVTRGGPVNSPNPAVQQLKVKVLQLQGSALTQLPLAADGSTAFAPFAALSGPASAINRDGRVAFVDSDGNGKAELVVSALDPLTDPTNEQVRVGVYAINVAATAGAATTVSTGSDAGTYLTGKAVVDHAITHVAGGGTPQVLALVAESALSGVVYLAPLTGTPQSPGGFALTIAHGGLAIDGI
ncbi:MAG: hypothetical protein K8U57_14000, partial [Planctomycetes bacterium]|nr:hypothetical protein [Planctomycetota bacterium]